MNPEPRAKSLGLEEAQGAAAMNTPPQVETTQLPKPWDRLTKETPKAYQAFTAYLLLGPGRSMDRAAKELGRPGVTSVADWGRENGWVERARAFDEEQARTALTAFQEVGVQDYTTFAAGRRAAATKLGQLCDRMLDHAAKRLEQLEEARNRAIAAGTKEEDLPVVELDARLSSYIRAIADVDSKAGDAMALALGIDRLVAVEDGKP